MTSPSTSACFVFNGDADGLISQHLMQLSGITPFTRITGLKREIVLLGQTPLPKTASPLSVHVFDLSLDANRLDLLRLLENPQIEIRWFDHHEPGVIPNSPRLHTHIFNTRGTCTALIVHGELKFSDARWAAMAAFGDNIPEAAEAMLRPLNLPQSEMALLREAGELLNYNAYGESRADVLFHPLEVAERLSPYRDPVEFIRDSGVIQPLREQFLEDVSRAAGLSPKEASGSAKIYELPSQPWARRIGASFINRVALENPSQAVAALHALHDGSYQVSIRAPRNRKGGVPFASDLAREFSTGGGRALAAGINHLPAADIPRFNRRFFELYAA